MVKGLSYLHTHVPFPPSSPSRRRQVGVKSVLGGSAVYWYHCTDGLNLKIPGFAGQISCPPDVGAWCASESITGVQYPEVNRAW